MPHLQQSVFIRVYLWPIGLDVKQQAPISVLYDGIAVGEYFADLLVSDTAIVELKAVKEFSDAHAAQCVNYLKATRLPICLLLNFGKPRVAVKRYRL